TARRAPPAPVARPGRRSRGRRRRRPGPAGGGRGRPRGGSRQMRRRQRTPELEERAAALGTAVERGDGVVPADDLAPARRLIERMGERRALASGVTVAALLGATGSGKSSLFNALVGESLADVHARRPTTTHPLAAVWEAPGAAT